MFPEIRVFAQPEDAAIIRRGRRMDSGTGQRVAVFLQSGMRDARLESAIHPKGLTARKLKKQHASEKTGRQRQRPERLQKKERAARPARFRDPSAPLLPS